MYWEDFKQIYSPYPPVGEQTQIADAIEESTQGLNCAIDQMEREIALLREYRTRLIGDVVTGKLDVREAVANLPEEVAEPEALEEAEELDDSATGEEIEVDEAIETEEAAEVSE